jgi:hypothetical protein
MKFNYPGSDTNFFLVDKKTSYIGELIGLEKFEMQVWILDVAVCDGSV